MDEAQTFRLWPPEMFAAALQQRYPESCLRIIEDISEQVVFQLDQFMITITSQKVVEVAAPTNFHQRVEQLVTEIEQLLSQVSSHLQKQTDW